MQSKTDRARRVLLVLLAAAALAAGFGLLTARRTLRAVQHSLSAAQSQLQEERAARTALEAEAETLRAQVEALTAQAAAQAAQLDAVAAGHSPATQLVYITPSGGKYHTRSCVYLSDDAIPIALDDARRGGYQPCSRCQPAAP